MALLSIKGEEYEVDAELTNINPIFDSSIYVPFTKSFTINLIPNSILNNYLNINSFSETQKTIEAELYFGGTYLSGYIIIESFDFSFDSIKSVTLTFYQNNSLIGEYKDQKIKDIIGDISEYNHYYNIDNIAWLSSSDIYNPDLNSFLNSGTYSPTPLELGLSYSYNKYNPIKYKYTSLIKYNIFKTEFNKNKNPLEYLNTYFNNTDFLLSFDSDTLLKKIFSNININYDVSNITKYNCFTSFNLQETDEKWYYDSTDGDYSNYTPQKKKKFNLCHGDDFINNNSFIAGLTQSVKSTSSVVNPSLTTFTTNNLKFNTELPDTKITVGTVSYNTFRMDFFSLPKDGTFGYFIPVNAFSYNIASSIGQTWTYSHGTFTPARPSLNQVYSDLINRFNQQNNLTSNYTYSFVQNSASSFSINFTPFNLTNKVNIDWTPAPYMGYYVQYTNTAQSDIQSFTVSYRNTLGFEKVYGITTSTLRIDNNDGKLKSGYDVINQKVSIYLDVDLPNYINSASASFITNELRISACRARNGVETVFWDDRLFQLSSNGVILYANPNLFFERRSPLFLWSGTGISQAFDKSYKIWGTLTFSLDSYYGKGLGEETEPLFHRYLDGTEEELYFRIYSYQTSSTNSTTPSNKIQNSFLLDKSTYIYNQVSPEVREGSIIRVKDFLPDLTLSEYFNDYNITNNVFTRIPTIKDNNLQYKYILNRADSIDISDYIINENINIQYNNQNIINNFRVLNKDNSILLNKQLNKKSSINKDLKLNTNFINYIRNTFYTYQYSIENKKTYNILFGKELGKIIYYNYRLDLHNLGSIDNFSILKTSHVRNYIRSLKYNNNINIINNINNIDYYIEVDLNVSSDLSLIDKLMNETLTVFIQQLNSTFTILESIYSDTTYTMKLKLIKTR